jgi:hypothetical protein
MAVVRSIKQPTKLDHCALESRGRKSLLQKQAGVQAH